MPIDSFYTKRKQTTSGILKNDQSIVEEMKVITLKLFSPIHRKYCFLTHSKEIYDFMRQNVILSGHNNIEITHGFTF